MAQEPSPIKLFQIEEPDGAQDAGDGFGLAVGIELSQANGASVAASVGGNPEVVVRADGTRIPASASETDIAHLLRDLRALTERAVARPVTHAVIRIDGIDLSEAALLRAAAAADIALLGIRRNGTALDAAIEAEDIATVLSR